MMSQTLYSYGPNTVMMPSSKPNIPARDFRAPTQVNTMPPETKSAIIRRLMAAEDWRAAMAVAARLPRLDKHRNAILDAHGAYVRPSWPAQVGKDASTLIARGIAALKERFPNDR